LNIRRPRAIVFVSLTAYTNQEVYGTVVVANNSLYVNLLYSLD